MLYFKGPGAKRLDAECSSESGLGSGTSGLKHSDLGMRSDRFRGKKDSKKVMPGCDYLSFFPFLGPGGLNIL